MRIERNKVYRCRGGHLWRWTGEVEAVGKYPEHVILYKMACVKAFVCPPVGDAAPSLPKANEYLTQTGKWCLNKGVSDRDLVESVPVLERHHV